MSERRIDPDAYAYNNVMAASRKVNDFWVAPILLENMREGMVQVDAWSYSQAMDASNAMGSWQASLQYLQELQDSQVQGNSVVLSAAITACQLGQQPRMALDLLTADVGGAVPDAQAYTAAITACGTASLWDSALEVLEDMLSALFCADSKVCLCKFDHHLFLKNFLAHSCSNQLLGFGNHGISPRCQFAMWLEMDHQHSRPAWAEQLLLEGIHNPFATTLYSWRLRWSLFPHACVAYQRWSQRNISGIALRS
eukprot:symbB.v1.2.033687.t1/scaffold4221.1/size42938/2